MKNDCKSLRLLLLFIAMIVCCAAAEAFRNEVVMNSQDITRTSFNDTNTTYIIKGDLRATEKIDMPSGCVLVFDGGTINGMGKSLNGNYTEIIAPMYQIFDSITLTGNFLNDSFSAHWFGALGNGVHNDAPAINTALKNDCGVRIDLGNGIYRIESPIIMDKNGQRLSCQGTIFTYNDQSILDLRAGELDVDLNSLRYGEDSDYALSDYKGTGVKFSGNVSNSNIRVNNIKNVRNGFAFIPSAIQLNRNYCGAQYNKIYWQFIQAYHGIYFNLLTSPLYERNLWANENQFFGGRLSGYSGIYVERPVSPRKPRYDYINGNVFNSIGFEDIILPVYLDHAQLNTFHDLRMSESINNSSNRDTTIHYYIDLNDCAFMTFDIKSLFDHNKFNASGCRGIDVNKSITDSGYGTTFRFGKLIADSLLKGDHGNNILVSTSPSVNIVKNLYYDLNNRPGPINFNDLFERTYDHVLMLSNKCVITMYDNINLEVQLKNSIYDFNPDLYLRCNLYGGSTILFKDENNNDEARINSTGTYLITFTKNDSLIVIPM